MTSRKKSRQKRQVVRAIPLSKRGSTSGDHLRAKPSVAQEVASLLGKVQQAQGAYKASEQQYFLTLNSLTDCIHVMDRNLRIVFINRAVHRLCDQLGIPHGRIGQSLRKVFPFLPDKVWNEYRTVFRSGRPLNTEDATQIAGKTTFTETRKMPIVEQGKVVRVVTIMRVPR